MIDKTLVSVIVPTRNNADTLEACLRSIYSQSYTTVELIVVDRDSTDATPSIASRFTRQVYNCGPERSAQRNFGAAYAEGMYICFIDSDMILEPDVISNCLAQCENNPRLTAVTIPETSFGQGFWAKCKSLERSYYGVDWIECPRFMPISVFQNSGGYNEKVAGGEDGDLTQRLSDYGPFGRIPSLIHHDEGRVKFRELVKKRSRLFGEGWVQNGRRNHYTDGPRLLALYCSRPRTILLHPLTWVGMIFMRTIELSARAFGYIRAKHSQKAQIPL